MSSNQRTYGRKRKEGAEDKFDAIFGTEPVKKRITVEIGGLKNSNKTTRKSFSPTKKQSSGNGFDRCVKLNTSLVSNQVEVSSNAYVHPIDEKSQTSPNTTLSTTNDIYHSRNVKFGRKNVTPNDKTKYDLLFKKSEKNASDKFDALFGDEIEGMQTKTPIAKPEESHVKSPDFNNLFGFGDSPDARIQQNTQSNDSLPHKQIDLEKIPKLSPATSLNKGLGITGAAMKTIGGKVVLNIHKRIKSPKKMVTIIPSESRKENMSSKGDIAAHEKNFVSSASNAFHFDGEEIKKKSEVKQLRRLANPAMPDIKSSMPVASASTVDNKLKNDRILLVSIKPPSQKNTSISPNKHVSFPSKSVKRKVTAKVSPPLKQMAASKVSYNPRPWMPDSEDSTLNTDEDSQSLSQPDSVQSSTNITPQLTRSVTWPDQVGESIVTSIKCDKAAKSYFTVVKHVKNYQNCLEEGEAQEFKDEVDYLLEGLQPSQPISVRCLSVTNLANKCQQHNFRLYLRAHNISDKVFTHLQDAKDNQNLAISTAALLFMLSRDRQMEISKTTLQLLLRLVDPFDKNDSVPDPVKPGNTNKEKISGRKYKFFKSKDKGMEGNETATSCETVNKIKDMVESCGDHLLSGEDVSVKRLSSEALLRFTARRTVGWFREEVRIKGGLDHIISLIKSHVETSEAMFKNGHDDEKFEAKYTLCTLERFLKVLENAIVNSPRNAMYLVTHQRAVLLKKLATLMNLCKSWLFLHPYRSPLNGGGGGDAPPPTDDPYVILRNTILQVIKLLVNISNDNEWVSTRVGEQDGMLHSIVDCALLIPARLEEPHRYELTLLSLSLLVNLVESSAKNRIEIMKMTTGSRMGGVGDSDPASQIPVVQSLVQLFLDREAAARDNEVLGEEGVKKAAEAKKSTTSDSSDISGSQPSGSIRATEHDGHWEETEDGMEWVPAEDTDDTTISSQESHRSNISSSKNPESALTAEEKNEMKETLDKANEHMEHSIVASYAALVLGCLIHGNRANSSVIRGFLSNEDGFRPMVNMLKKFLSFMSLTAGMSGKGEKTLTQIIEVIEEESSQKLERLSHERLLD